nr:PQQ-binding-like beta-propeller repeat protein [Polymorphobacter sp.]
MMPALTRPTPLIALTMVALIASAAYSRAQPPVQPPAKAQAAPAPKSPKRITSFDEMQAPDPSRINPATAPGNPVFQQHCAMCHLGGVPKAPSPNFMGMMAPDAIVHALTDGVMRTQAASLTPQQKIEVAEYLTRIPYASYKPAAPPPICTGAAAQFDMDDVPQPIGWGHDNRRFVPAQVAGLTKAEVPQLALKWAFAYPAANRARSQPVIGWGTVFVGSQDGTIYAFDPATGCTRWTKRLAAEVRTAIVADAASKRLYFGDLLGRAHALDAMSGKELWSTKVSDHASATITGTPSLGGGLLYVPVSSLEVVEAADTKYACCTFRGSVLALDAATGKEVWRAYTAGQPTDQGKTKQGTRILGPSGAPVWSSPTYDERSGRVYFGSGENYSSPADENSDAVFAVDAKTGARIWNTQLTPHDAWNVGCMMGNDSCPKENGPDFDIAASVLLIPLDGEQRILVVGQKSGEAWGIDPDTGKIRWNKRLGHGGTQGGVHFGMAAEGQRVFVPINDMADTHDARVYDAKLRGAGLHAIDAATGAEFWYANPTHDCAGRQFCDPGISAAVTAIPGVVFAGHLDGMFRAYDGKTGGILWETDTTKPVRTIDGRTGNGGSMSGPGAAVWKGQVFVNSGYGLYSHIAGNVLLAYGPKGKSPH